VVQSGLVSLDQSISVNKPSLIQARSLHVVRIRLLGCESVFIELDLFFKLFFVGLGFLSTLERFAADLSYALCS
jgi:hypothetical protein